MPIERHHSFMRTLIIFFACLIFIVVFGTLTCGLWYNQQTMQSVLTEGFQTDALLENKYSDENNRFWLSYRFTTLTDDTYSSAIEVPEMLYNEYTIGTVLPMRYLAENPEFNALDIFADEINADSRPIIQFAIFVVILALVLVFIGLRDFSFSRISHLWKSRG